MKELTARQQATDLSRLMSLRQFDIGDTVKIIANPRTIAGSLPVVEIEKIDFDHSHPSGHVETCFSADRIAYYVVLDPQLDGSAKYRGRYHAANLRLRTKEAQQ